MNASRTARALAIGISCLPVACSEIVGIEDRSGTWCTLEESSHDFCDDFDQPDPLARWSVDPNAAPAIDSSASSEPNALLAHSGVVLQRHIAQPSNGVLLELDLRIEAKTDKPPPATHDHAVALISRSGGSAGLFAGPGNSLFFGFMSSIPEPLAELSLAGRWVRFGISIDGGTDARQARLEVDGAVVKVVVLPDSDPEDEKNREPVPSDVILGAQKLGDPAQPIELAFDNVTVDLTGGTDPSGTSP